MMKHCSICTVKINGISCSSRLLDIRAHLRKVNSLFPTDSGAVNQNICSNRAFFPKSMKFGMCVE